MKSIDIPFSLYDFFAILLPGFVGIFGIYLFFDPALTLLKLYEVTGEVNEILILTGLIVSSYFAGHILNAFSEILIDKPANAILGWPANEYLANQGLLVKLGLHGFAIVNGRLKFPKRLYAWNETSKPKAIGEVLNACIEKTFGPVCKEWSYTYVLIRAYVNEKLDDISAETRVFAANSAMFSSLCTATLLVSGAMVQGILVGALNRAILFPAISVNAILLLMFFFSYRRYKRLWTETLYAGFIMATANPKKPENQKEILE